MTSHQLDKLMKQKQTKLLSPAFPIMQIGRQSLNVRESIRDAIQRNTTRPLNIGGALLSISVVPEPSGLALLRGGMIALATRVAPSLKGKLKKLAIA